MGNYAKEGTNGPLRALRRSTEALSEVVLMMWTQRTAPALSDWERAERAAAMEHAVRLVARGASVAASAEACGVSDDALRHRVTRMSRHRSSRNWSPDEDARLDEALAECGSWREVTARVETRGMSACKNRAHYRGMSLRSARGVAE